MSQEKTTQISFPFFSIMFLIFMTLKLTGHITWSWWWVTAPLWMPAAFLIGILLVLLVIAGIVALLN